MDKLTFTISLPVLDTPYKSVDPHIPEQAVLLTQHAEISAAAGQLLDVWPTDKNHLPLADSQSMLELLRHIICSLGEVPFKVTAPNRLENSFLDGQYLSPAETWPLLHHLPILYPFVLAFL